MRCSLIYVLPLLVAGIIAAPSPDPEVGSLSAHAAALEARDIEAVDFEARGVEFDSELVARDAEAGADAHAEFELEARDADAEAEADSETHELFARGNLNGASVTAKSNVNTIKSLQWELVNRGQKLTVDGDFGAKTKAAIIAFQKSKKLVADGSAGPITLGALVSDVKKGSKGNAAKGAQAALNAFGSKLVVDGDFGTTSHNAAVAFQKSKGLVADGVVGDLTWTKLYGGSGGGGGGGGTPPPVGNCDSVHASVPISATTVVAGFRVHKCIAAKFGAMISAASKDGVKLTGWGWRDQAQQIALRKKHCPGGDVWKVPASKCNPPTAIPGTSRHERGLAVDFSSMTRSTAGYKWLSRNAAKYHFKNLPSEAWHWSYDGY